MVFFSGDVVIVAVLEVVIDSVGMGSEVGVVEVKGSEVCTLWMVGSLSVLESLSRRIGLVFYLFAFFDFGEEVVAGAFRLSTIRGTTRCFSIN